MSATQTCVAIQKGRVRFSLQSRRSLRLPACYLAIAAFGAAIACSAAHAESIPTTARWLGASDGSWDDSTRWSTPQFPNNGSPGASDTYHAVIDAAGAAYQVGLATDITLDKLTINSTDAELNVSTGALHARDGIELLAGELFIFRPNASSLPYPVIRDTHLTVAEGALVKMVNGYLDNVTITGKLETNRDYTVFVQNDVTLDNGHLQVLDELYFLAGEHTVGGSGTVELYGQGQMLARSHATVTFDSGVVVTGGGSVGTDPDARVINKGVFRVTNMPHSLTIGGSFENQGRIEVTDGGHLGISIKADPYRYPWTNNGVIAIDSGTLSFSGNYDQSDLGTIQRTGGTIVVGGNLNNVGKTFQLDAATGSWELQGEIIGGTVETRDGTELYVGYSYYPYGGAELSGGVILNGQLGLRSAKRMTVRDGMTLGGRLEVQSHNSTELTFEGSQTLSGTGEVVFTPEHGGGEIFPLRGVLTIGPEITIRTDGDGGILGRAEEEEGDGILNLGTISAETAGKTIRMAGTNFGNQGTVQAIGGGTARIEDRALRDVIDGVLVGGRWIAGENSTIELGSATVLTNSADVTLRGGGSSMPAIDSLRHNRGKLTIEQGRNFTTAGELDNLGQLVVGHDCTLRIGGDYRQQDLGRLVIRMAGLTPGEGHGLLDVGGAATLDGTLEVLLADGYVPALGDTFDVLDFDTLTLTSNVADLLALDTLPSGLYWDTGRFAADGSLTVVPEPGTLFGAIVFLLGLLIWSRHGRRPPGTSRAGTLPAVFAAVTAGLIGFSTAEAASTDIYWQNTGAGDWFDPLNWAPHVPVDGDVAYIDNGGTAQVVTDALSADLPDRIYVGYDSSGTLEHTAGEWSGDRYLGMGVNPGSSGTYKIGGTAVARFHIEMGYAGDALIEQTGGELSSWQAYVGSNGKMQHSGGTYRVSDRLFFMGDYELSGTAHLDIGDDFELGHGASLVQTGGMLEAVEVRVEDAGTSCRLENGEYWTGRTWVQEGSFVLNGGVMDPGSLWINPQGSLTVNGGTLVMSDYVSAGSRVSFQPGNWSLDVQTGIADYGSSEFADLSAASFSSQPDTLTVFPAGVDTSQFAVYAPLGLVHVAGSDLHVRSTDHIAGRTTITDHLIVEGGLNAAAAGSSTPKIDALNGIEVRSGGQVNLAAGTLVVNDHRSRLESGHLKARYFYVGKSGSGSFIHTGGYFDDGDTSSSGPTIHVGYGEGADGYYELSGTGHVRAEEINVGWEETSRGHFKQLGGTVSLGFSTGSHVYVSKNSLYELIDGTLGNSDTAVSGRFIQTGGYHRNRRGADVPGSRDGTGLFELRGGTHETDYDGLKIGRFKGSTGTYVVSGSGESIGDELLVANGLFRQESGKAVFSREVEVRPHPGRTGRIELVAGQFSGGTLTMVGETPEAAVFKQSGGTCTLEEMFLGSYYDYGLTDGGTYSIDGGDLDVSGAATIGTWRIYSYDRPVGEGVLEIGGGSATFGDLVLGEDFGYGGYGTLRITATTAQMRVKGSLKLGGNAVVSAVPGASLKMGGRVFLPSSFENESTDAAALAGLGDLALLFDGGPYALNSLEVAGEDLGLRAEGLTLNFALNTLRVGGDDVAHLQLIDVFDNQQDEQLGNESLYVRRLVVGPDSWLDLNGLNLYCLSASIDAKAVVMENGGVLAVVPEPSTLVLLWLGLSSVFAWGFFRRRRSGRATQ